MDYAWSRWDNAFETYVSQDRLHIVSREELIVWNASHAFEEKEEKRAGSALVFGYVDGSLVSGSRRPWWSCSAVQLNLNILDAT